MTTRRRLLVTTAHLSLALGLTGVATARPAPAISRLDDHTYRVDRAALAAELTGGQAPRGRAFPLRELTRAAYFIPDVRGGEARGMRLMRVQREGAIGRLGFRDGDVVRAVNGLPVGGPPEALRIYDRLKGASKLTVAIERDGRPAQLVYLLR